MGTSTSSKWIHIQGKRQKMDRHTPKGSVRTGHGVPCGALPLIKTKKKMKNVTYIYWLLVDLISNSLTNIKRIITVNIWISYVWTAVEEMNMEAILAVLNST